MFIKQTTRYLISLFLFVVLHILLAVNIINASDSFVSIDEQPNMNKESSYLDFSPIRQINYLYEGTEYIPYSELQFTYSMDGKILVDNGYNYIDGELKNNFRTLYEHNDQGFIQVSIRSLWINGIWSEDSRTTYSYIENKKQQDFTEIYSEGSWEPSSRRDYVYSDDGTTYTMLYSIYMGEEWSPLIKYTYYLDNDGKRQIVFFGVYSDGIYYEDEKEVYEYNDNGLISSVTDYERISEDDPWFVKSIDTYSYDNLGRNICIDTERYISYEDVPYVYENTTYSFDSEGRRISFEQFSRESLTDPWSPLQKSLLFYEEATAVTREQLPATFALLANSPNPFNPATTISFTLAEAGHVTLDVYNTAGQKVASLMEGDMTAGYHQEIWNARGFATGIYVTRLTVDGLTKTGKMTLMK